MRKSTKTIEKTKKQELEIIIITNKSIINTVKQEIKEILEKNYRLEEKVNFNENHDSSDEFSEQGIICRRNGSQVKITINMNTTPRNTYDFKNDFEDNLIFNNYRIDAHENRAVQPIEYKQRSSNEDTEELVFLMD